MYNYTKPRRPIAAMYTSPGPCYGLPTLVGYPNHDPRSVHRKMPAYIFGLALPISNETIGPGPAKYWLGKMHKDGPFNPPAWTMAALLNDIKGFLTPAPGTYRPEDCMTITHPRAPEYSFGLRHRQVRADNVPAPNAYVLDSMLGRTVRSSKPMAPVYSMLARNQRFSFQWDWAQTPGPCAYTVPVNNIYLLRPPIYSLTSKHYLPVDRTQKPGPGAHENEKVWIHKRAAPIYSFGIRHSPYTTPIIVAVDDDY